MNVKSVATLLLMIPLVSAVSHAQPLNITLTRSYAGEPILYRRLRLGPVTISPYGYIKYELFYDSRQNIGSREVETHLFPLPILPDICGRDTNAHAKFQMSIIETRAGVKFKGPSWGSLKAIGLIEGDFRGVSELTLQTLRLRHAFGRIEWDTGSFLFGQYWHPMVAEECFPHTVSINRGVPIESRARNPQLRVTERWGDIELMVAALSQQSFLSTGPIGISSEYIRNSLMPNFHCQLRGYKGAFFCGIAGDVLRLVPRLVSDKNVKVNEHIVSFRGEAFASWTYPSWSLRTKVLYAQNGNDLLLISGFGVHTVDPKTDFRTYTNTACAAAWVDASYFFYNDTMELGLFAGGTKNLGSVRSLFIDPATQEPIIYTLVDIAKDLSYVARISPRYAFVKDPVRFGLEIEYTRAAFGKARKNGQIAHTRPVNNVRVLAALYYVF